MLETEDCIFSTASEWHVAFSLQIKYTYGNKYTYYWSSALDLRLQR